jgi:hypothetical protein
VAVAEGIGRVGRRRLFLAGEPGGRVREDFFLRSAYELSPAESDGFRRTAEEQTYSNVAPLFEERG